MLTKLSKQLASGKVLARFSLLKASGQVFEMLIPFGLAVVIAPDIFGIYSLGKMVVFLFASLFVFSSLTPFVVFSNQEAQQTGKINNSFSVQVVLVALSAGLFLLITLLGGTYIKTFTELNSSELIFLVLAYFGITIRFFLENIFLALNQKTKNAAVDFFYGLVSVVTIVILYRFHVLSVSTLFLTYFIAALAVLAIYLRFINFSLLRPFHVERSHFKKMFNFAKWNIVGSTAVYLTNWGDNFVLRLFVSVDQIGIYNLGYQTFKGLTGLYFILNSYFLPSISKTIEDVKAVQNYVFNKRPKIFLLVLVFIVGFYLLLPTIFHAIYSASYDGAIIVLKILLIGSVLELYNVFYIPILNASRKYKFTQTTNIVQVLINLGLDFLLIPALGITGAAIATVTAYTARNLIYEIYVYRKFKDFSFISRWFGHQG